MEQTITIFGAISDATSAQVTATLASFDRSLPVLVRIDSDGGSVRSGVAIFAALQAWPAGVTTEVVGWALSAATLVLMAGRVRRCHPAASLMVHGPWLDGGPGNAPQLRERAEALESVGAAMAVAYRQTGQPESVIRQWMESGRDFWFTADEALAASLVTEIQGAAVEPAAFSNFQLRAASLPASIKAQLMSTTTSTADHQAALQAGIQAEARRRSRIKAHFAHYMQTDGVQELLQACEADTTVTAEAAGLKLLAHLGSQATPIMGNFRIREGADRLVDFRAAAVDTLLQRAGLRVEQPHPASRDLARMDLVGMAEACLSLTGRPPATGGRDGILKAALSTSDFPSLLGNTAQRALSIGYQEAASGAVLISSERELSDFRAATLANLSEAPGLKPVAELAEYTFGQLADSGQPFKVEPFGRLLMVSRQAIINDDLAAFTRLPAAFGAAARRLEADLIFKLLTANPTLADGVPLFHATHGNLGAPAALSVPALAAARAMMRRQKGLLGESYVDPAPSLLIVPVSLQTAAEQLVATLHDPSVTTGANVEQPAFIRGLTVVADPRLDEVSETAWYLSASPRQFDGLVRCYLQGQPRPFLDESQEFARDALTWKCRMDFGAAVMDHRPLYRNAGI